MRTLNLGILAHVDAGKTSLTERLLFAAGVIEEVGSVDAGSTQTDSLALERQRGITIRSAVTSFAVDDVAVSLIDTPGHPDFIAEVERVLSVLDGAVLIVSAVEGVQSQTRVLMRTLRRLRIPTLIFVNKIDRAGARPGRVLDDVRRKLSARVVAMGTTASPGTPAARFAPYTADGVGFTARLVELLADDDDELLTAFVDDEASVTHSRLRAALAARTAEGRSHPVFFGSAISGAGVGALIEGITRLLPAGEGDVDAPLSARVFKIERGRAGEKLAYVRVFTGAIRVRDRVRLDRDREEKVTGIAVFEAGPAVRRDALVAGRIGIVRGLAGSRIGDAIGGPSGRSPAREFAPPTLEAAVLPRHPADRGRLFVALQQLAEQDPLIDVRQGGDGGRDVVVTLYGEVQKQVVEHTLGAEFDLEVEFRETTTICIERPLGVGAAVELLGRAANPFLATVGLRVEPGAAGGGISFRLDVELGSIPLYVYRSVDGFRDAIEATVRDTLREGLAGWQVTDCAVTMTHSGYVPPGSTAADFRRLAPLVLMTALRRARTGVHEPMHRFRAEVPSSTVAALLPALGRLRAVVRSQQVRGPVCVLEGEIAAARLHGLQRRLPALTHGEGVLESSFDSYRPVRGTPPTRARTDPDPLDRKAYLAHVLRPGARPGSA